MGFVCDLEFDSCTGCVKYLIVPGPGCICGIFGKEKEYVIPFCKVRQIGEDIVLVEIGKIEEVEKICKLE